MSPYVNGQNNNDDESINKSLLQDTDLIVTTTGNVNVCDKHILNNLKSGSIVCNIGHFDNEIDTAYMRDKWTWEEIKPQVHKIYRDSKDPSNYLILLSEGRLVNLGNATGHPSRIMDGYEVVSPYVNGQNNNDDESINKSLLQDTDLIVTTTGNVNVCDKHILNNLKSGSIV